MKAVRYILANDANVTSVIPADSIWRNQPKQTNNRPYIVIDTEDVIPSNQIAATSNRDEYRVKVSVFADVLETTGAIVGAETAAALCRTSLEAYYTGGIIDGDDLHISFEDQFDASMKVGSQNAHMVTQEYSVKLKR